MTAQMEERRRATGAIDVAVLDDDVDFRQYLEDFLQDEGGYSVRVFARPDELIAAAETRTPDIVLLDMMMGEFRGDRVLADLLARWPKLCVIILTGYPSLTDMRATFKMQVFDYLTKPFSLAQLRTVLHNAEETYGLGRGDPERLRERLGHRVRVLRAEQHWSLKQLAEASDLSISQLSSIERGAHMPSMESLLAICRALSVRPSALLDSVGF